MLKHWPCFGVKFALAHGNNSLTEQTQIKPWKKLKYFKYLAKNVVCT